MIADLIAFLRERLDDEGQAARAATPGPWRAEPYSYGEGYGAPQDWEIRSGSVDVVSHQPYEGGGIHHEEDAEHIARHDPMSVLADIAAKHAVLDHYERVAAYCRQQGHEDYALAEGALRTSLRHLALAYADHADYREAWRP